MRSTIVTDDKFSYMWKNLVTNNTNLIGWALRYTKFKDKWPNLFFTKVKELIKNKEVTYIWDFSRPEDLFMNLSIINWIVDSYANKVRIILPYFPVWTMERVDKDWEIATAKCFAEIMSNVPSWRTWKTSIHILDIHALVERYLFDNHKVSVELHSAMSLLKEELKWKVPVFPDDWANKRFWCAFEEKVICDKTRDWENRRVTIKEGDIKWKDAIIIDDLIQTWWTIIETSDVLKESWANSVTSFSTHWVFPEDSHLKVAAAVDKLIVTDSIPENIERAKDVDNMEVISIEPLIKDIIFGNI